MKDKLLVFSVLNLVCFSLLYLIFAFVSLSFDVFVWGEGYRMMFAGIYLWLEYKIIDYIIDELWKKDK